MYKEYSAGRTPNPDVLCNKFIKFGAWMKKAEQLGFDYIATGHYARLKKSKNKILLLSAKDTNKDQTYFLHQLNQKQLRKIIFPIGGYTKDEVRALAKKFDLPTAEKAESMGICFVGEVPMKDFLKDKVKARGGKILMTDGKEIGHHDGLAFYTIGERGLGLNNINGKPLFVVGKNIQKNELIVGFGDDTKLFKNKIIIKDVNWISGQQPKFPLKCKVRLRHRQELQSAVVCHSRTVPAIGCAPSTGRRESGNTAALNNELLIKLAKSQRAVTSGQFAVIYSKGECIGGGVIK
jgi:tRNA-specific 2-thiouridylase